MAISSSESKANKKSIKIEVTDNEHQYISGQANELKISIRKFVKMKALDHNSSTDMRCRKIMQLMPEFYNLVQQVEDMHTHQSLMEIGGAICRCLK